MTERNPVLLVHGIDDTAAKLRTMSTYLAQRGWSVYDLDLVPNNGAVGLNQLAQQVADFAKAAFLDRPFDLVGFSMGGVVSRYYIQRLGGIHQVQRFITISSPHHGTWTGYIRSNLGCIQMRPNSDYLNDINLDVTMLEQINFTSIWTPYDLMIVPASSSQMPVGKEIKLPVLLHSLMVVDPRCLQAVAETLKEPLRTQNATRT